MRSRIGCDLLEFARFHLSLEYADLEDVDRNLMDGLWWSVWSPERSGFGEIPMIVHSREPIVVNARTLYLVMRRIADCRDKLGILAKGGERSFNLSQETRDEVLGGLD
jgi:hypothetical protein